MAQILVIDDEDGVRGVLVRLLRILGHEVIDAADGMEGMKFFRAQRFDLVFTDLVMPGKEGIELIGELRKLSPHIAIVAMSGDLVKAPSNYLKLASFLGASCTLEKPFVAATVIKILEELLPDTQLQTNSG